MKKDVMSALSANEVSLVLDLGLGLGLGLGRGFF